MVRERELAAVDLAAFNFRPDEFMMEAVEGVQLLSEADPAVGRPVERVPAGKGMHAGTGSEFSRISKTPLRCRYTRDVLRRHAKLRVPPAAASRGVCLLGIVALSAPICRNAQRDRYCRSKRGAASADRIGTPVPAMLLFAFRRSTKRITPPPCTLARECRTV